MRKRTFDENGAALLRAVGIGAIVWGVSQVHVHHGPVAVAAVLTVLGALGSLTWLAEVDGRRLLVAMVVTALAGGIVCVQQQGSPAVAFAAVAASVSFAKLPQREAVTVTLIGCAITGLGLLLIGHDAAAAGYTLVIVASASIGNGRGRAAERQQEREVNAALQERARLAREIHDVLAHSLSGLAIQLEAADALLSELGDVDGALARVRRARRLAVDGLDETRRAVAALRTDAPPLPDALASLVEQHRELAGAGAVSVTGTPRPIAPETTLALLRVATEALTNARRHAPGAPVRVDLDYTPDSVSLLVTDNGNDGPPGAATDDGGGAGLAGMRERLALLGGQLTAGPGPTGWRVDARVPA